MYNIARAIGVPLRLDQATINGDFGHYARVLVDIDLKHPLLYQLEVDSNGECGFVNVEYENISNFYTTCSSIGHPATCCKLNQLKEDKDVHAKFVKPTGKKTVFKDDSDNEEFDNENLEKMGDNGNTKSTREANCDDGSPRWVDLDHSDHVDLDHSDHVHGQQVCDGGKCARMRFWG